MNKAPLPTTWSKKKEKLMDRYPVLSEEDLLYEKGKEQHLITRLKEKLNKPRAEIKQIIKSL